MVPMLGKQERRETGLERSDEAVWKKGLAVRALKHCPNRLLKMGHEKSVLDQHFSFSAPQSAFPETQSHIPVQI